MNPERLLAHFDRVVEAPDAIPRLRCFLLDLAVRGTLVEQDPSDEPATDLLERIQLEQRVSLERHGGGEKQTPHLRRLKGHFQLPVGWAIAEIAELFLSVADGDHQPPPKVENGIPLLVIGNIRNRSIDFTGCRHVPLSYYNSLGVIRRPTKGDVLYTLFGSYGIPVLVGDDRAFCVQRHIGILRPSKHLDTGFLIRALESGTVFEQATACATGIAQKTVTLSGLRRIQIPIPPLAEQHRIVAKVDELMALCDKLEKQLTISEGKSRRLLEALLHEALEDEDVEGTDVADDSPRARG